MTEQERFTSIATEYCLLIEQYYGKIIDIKMKIAQWQRSKSNDGYGIPSMVGYNEIRVEKDDDEILICVDWEEFWNYGGHDKGTMIFNSRFLFDDKALEEYLASEKKEVVLDYSI